MALRKFGRDLTGFGNSLLPQCHRAQNLIPLTSRAGMDLVHFGLQ